MNNYDDYMKDYIDIFNVKNYLKFLDKNIIIYGPSGIGKYSFVLNLIKNKSNSHLKYNKKIVVKLNKSEFYFKISDIHYEIDVSLLGCNAKLLWHEIYNHIIDSILSKNQNIAYILLKNFNKINNELLDIFHTYIQFDFTSYTNIKFIIISESLGFIGDNIINRCKLIDLARPSKGNYAKILEQNIDKGYNLNNIINIKDLKKNSFKIENNDKAKILNVNTLIIEEIMNVIKIKENFSFLKLRELLYDICIFELNIETLIYNLIEKLKNEKLISDKDINNILIENYKFLRLYNNNYRPIYHLEKIVIYISMQIWK